MGGPDPPGTSGGGNSPARLTARQKGKQRDDRAFRDKLTDDEVRQLSSFPPPPPVDGPSDATCSWVAHPGYRCVVCTDPACSTCLAYGQHRMHGYMDPDMGIIDRRMAALLHPELPRYAERMYNSWRVMEEISREGRGRLEDDVRYYRDQLDEAHDEIRDLRRQLDEMDDRRDVRRKIRNPTTGETSTMKIVEEKNEEPLPHYYDSEPDYGDAYSDDEKFPPLPASSSASRSFAAAAATSSHSLVNQREARPQFDEAGIPITRSAWEQTNRLAHIPGNRDALNACKALATAANRARNERRQMTTAQQIALSEWRVPAWAKEEQRSRSSRTGSDRTQPVAGAPPHPALAAARANPQVPISINPPPLPVAVESTVNIRRPGMGPPQSEDPPNRWAAYYHYERRVHRPPAGIQDPLNLRQVRGWRVMRMLSPTDQSAGASFGRQRTLFNQRFCELLAVPGQYRSIVVRDHLSIANVGNFHPLGGSIDNLTIEMVARHLADCGFSYAWANDCWDFAQAWVTDGRNDGRDLAASRQALGALPPDAVPPSLPHEPDALVDFMSLRPPGCPPSPAAGRPSRREMGLRSNRGRTTRAGGPASPHQGPAPPVPNSGQTAGESQPIVVNRAPTGVVNPVPPFTVNLPANAAGSSSGAPRAEPLITPGGPTISLGGLVTAPAYFNTGSTSSSHGSNAAGSSAAPSEPSVSGTPSVITDDVDEDMD
ncbi:hypothetical protein EYR36_006052 [Pleurotus pulmonarius]|nr:hypothetical protein EYR36_006052 [Pleurotus pulmonarius]KAF4600758.1 hypothetical protein EYR38_005403 [Pleurotus pulmonarius]